MGSPEADLPVEVGAKSILEALHHTTKEDNGQFLDIKVAGWDNKDVLTGYKGGVLSWYTCCRGKAVAILILAVTI